MPVSVYRLVLGNQNFASSPLAGKQLCWFNIQLNVEKHIEKIRAKNEENEEDYQKWSPLQPIVALPRIKPLSKSGQKTTIIREHEYFIPMISLLLSLENKA